MKRRTIATSVVTLLTLAVIAATPPASADTKVPTHRFQNKAYGFCLDSNFAGSVYINRECKSDNEFLKWQWKGVIPSEGIIKSENTTWCLDTDGTDIYTRECNSGRNQRWRVIKPAGAGLPWLYNLAAGECLGLDSAGRLHMESCRVDNRHLWRIVI